MVSFARSSGLTLLNSIVFLFWCGAPFRTQVIFCMAGGIVTVSFARSSGLTLLNSIIFPRLAPPPHGRRPVRGDPGPGATIWRPLRGLCADPA